MLHRNDYIELTDQIADEIISLPICQKYKALQQEMNQDKALQELIFAFSKAKEQYAEIERYGHKYHPDFKQVSQQLIDTKKTVFEHPLVKEFKVCERELQHLLNHVAKSINDVIQFENGRDKTNRGCGGGRCSH